MALSERDFDFIILHFHGEKMDKKLRAHRKPMNSAIIGDIVYVDGRYERVTGVKTIETAITRNWETITQIVTTTNGEYNRTLSIERGKDGKQ